MPKKQFRALQPGSMVDRLASLEEGDSLTISRPYREQLAEFDRWVSAAKRSMIGNMTPALARLRERHYERNYEIETGVMISGNNRAHVVLVVTRLADDT